LFLRSFYLSSVIALSEVLKMITDDFERSFFGDITEKITTITKKKRVNIYKLENRGRDNE
jgi:hypothetical protein